MNNLPDTLRRLHELATVGRPANYNALLDAAREIEKLRADNQTLRDEVITLQSAVLAESR